MDGPADRTHLTGDPQVVSVFRSFCFIPSKTAVHALPHYSGQLYVSKLIIAKPNRGELLSTIRTLERRRQSNPNDLAISPLSHYNFTLQLADPFVFVRGFSPAILARRCYTKANLVSLATGKLYD
jgi:hypothetical protein